MKSVLQSPSNSQSTNRIFPTYCLVWLGTASHPSENNLAVQEELPLPISSLQSFDQLDRCETFLQSCSPKSRIVFIVSGDFCREIIPQVHHLLQIFTIYIFCADKQLHQSWSEQYDKVIIISRKRFRNELFIG